MPESRGKACLGTLGMFIIDTFQFLDEDGRAEQPVDRGWGEQIGGAGSYAVVGARAWMDPEQLRMVISRGDDWTPEWQAILDSYSSPGRKGPWVFRDRKGELTTKAVNIYRGQRRGFDYLTPKLRIEPEDLIVEDSRFDADRFCGQLACPVTEDDFLNPKLRREQDDLNMEEGRLPEGIHFVCSPDRAEAIAMRVNELVAQKKGPLHGLQSRRPVLCWEPIPDSAVPENLGACLKLLRSIEVFSPNHEEAACLLSSNLPAGGDQMAAIAQMATMFLEREAEFGDPTQGNTAIICIRSGKLGSFVKPTSLPGFWIPAYHTDATAARVKDPTGGGNSWLGAFAAVLSQASSGRSRDDLLADSQLSLEAGQCASVSASYAIEQRGLPSIGRFLGKSDNATARLCELRNRSAREEFQPFT